uniref:Uncharacterized protein n=1 Tax=Anguilla anguilla TaxID=7936 RepID=A0A0E9RDX7_ANGAN
MKMKMKKGRTGDLLSDDELYSNRTEWHIHTMTFNRK